jgi:hypothetical protein
MAKTRTKTKRPKQGYLHPDLAPPSIPEIDAAAETYYEAMTDRQKLSKEEDDAKVNLIDVMKTHKQSRYTTPDGLVVDLLALNKVKVKRAKTDSNGEAE